MSVKQYEIFDLANTPDISLRSKKHISRSAKLRKYGKIYNNLKNNDNKSPTKSPRHPRSITQKTSRARRTPLNNSKKIDELPDSSKRDISKDIKKRPLTEYNKFIRQESKKEIYINMSSKDRLKSISEKWQQKK